MTLVEQCRVRLERAHYEVVSEARDGGVLRAYKGRYRKLRALIVIRDEKFTYLEAQSVFPMFRDMLPTQVEGAVEQFWREIDQIALETSRVGIRQDA